MKLAAIVGDLSKARRHKQADLSSKRRRRNGFTIFEKCISKRRIINIQDRGYVQRVTKGATTVPGKHPRRAMGQNTITIHEDEDAATTQSHHLRSMNNKDGFHAVVDEESAFEDDSDATETEDEIDESVAEDMRKLEENFKGISQKYRLINRIGEG